MPYYVSTLGFQELPIALRVILDKGLEIQIQQTMPV